MSDDAGQEGFSINAASDYNERIENDKVSLVAVNDLHTIGGDREVMVEERVAESVAGEQSIKVGGLRKVTVDSNYGVSAGSERVIVGAARAIRAGGNYVTKTPHFVRVVGGAKQEVGLHSLLLGGAEPDMTKTNFVAKPAVTKPTGPSTQPRNVAQYKLKCPACSSALAFEEGCVKCYSCGFSQC